MTVFTAEQLDLARLPPLTLVPVDQAAEALALKKGAAARLNAAGIPYDVEGLETDSVTILCEEFAYRKALDLQALNEAGRRLTVTYGYGEALDHAAATLFPDLGIRRLPLVANPRPYVYGTAAAEDWESDSRFQLRISLAPQALTPGSLGGYEYAALSAAPHLIDAVAYDYTSGLCKPGGIVVFVLGREPDPNPATAKPAEEEPAQLVIAQDALYDRTTKFGSDTLAVRAVRRVRVERGWTLGIRRGPDPTIVALAAREAYEAYTARTRQPDVIHARERYIGKPLYESGEKAALKVGGVEYVRAKAGTGQDVDPGLDGVVQVTALDLSPEIIGG